MHWNLIFSCFCPQRNKRLAWPVHRTMGLVILEMVLIVQVMIASSNGVSQITIALSFLLLVPLLWRSW